MLLATGHQKKNLNIFDKRFLLVPINMSKHWSLCVIINPGDISKKRSKTDGGAFGIIHLDSLRCHDSSLIFGNIMKWLRSEYKRLYHHSSIIAPKSYNEYCSAPVGEIFFAFYLRCIVTYQLTIVTHYYYIT